MNFATLSKRFAFLGLAVALLSLTGCKLPAPPPPDFPQISFKQFGPIKLAVGQVEVLQDYNPPMKYPNVEQSFPVSPGLMAERWAKDRLIAAGGAGVARFTVNRASVVTVELPRDDSFKGKLTTQQTTRYDAVLEVTLEIRNDRGYRDAVVTARVDRSQTVAEDITEADRQRVWFKMTQEMGDDLNAQMQKNVSDALTKYVMY